MDVCCSCPCLDTEIVCIYNLRVGARSDQATATVDATVIRYLMMQGAWICGRAERRRSLEAGRERGWCMFPFGLKGVKNVDL